MARNFFNGRRVTLGTVVGSWWHADEERYNARKRYVAQIKAEYKEREDKKQMIQMLKDRVQSQKEKVEN